MINSDNPSARTVEDAADAHDDPQALRTIQREIQRKFGRTLLRLQQYEQLIKRLIAEKDVAGQIGELHNIKARQLEAISKKTLGQVIGDLTGSYVTPALPDSCQQDLDISPCDSSSPWVRINFRIEMKEEDFKESKQKLADLVNLRNELVHHFLEIHDIWTEAGCLKAGAYLDDCYMQIEARCEPLRAWAKHNLALREQMADFIKTAEFRDYILHGTMPGRAEAFGASSDIVKLLRDAEATFAKDGWTFLQHAINYIHQHAPEHTPKRYGCRSWRQVLHESKRFEIRREQPIHGLPTETWYRSR